MTALIYLRREAQALDHADWMLATFDGQISSLRDLLEKHGHLPNLRWPGEATGGLPIA
jgi:hypothetical protein